ncbi:MAG: hypothetical protein RIR26_2940 [Pseudomonadota bacterium]
MKSIAASIRCLLGMTQCIALFAAFPALSEQALAQGLVFEKLTEPSPTTGAPAASQILSVPPIPAAESASPLAIPAKNTQNVSPSTQPTGTFAKAPAGNSAAAPSTDSNAVNTPPQSLPQTATAPEKNNPAEGEQTKQVIESSASTPNAPAASENPAENMVVPNGAALQSQLIPLSPNEGTPWNTLTAGAFLLLGLAAAGLMLVRLKNGRTLGLSKTEKQLQLLSTLSLSPKRQIVLLRIRDKEVAIASTEHGITMLTEMESGARQTDLAANEGGTEKSPRGRNAQPLLTMESPQLVASGRTSEPVGETATARSEMLMGALKSIREKTGRSRASSASASAASERREEREPQPLPVKNPSNTSKKEVAFSSEQSESRANGDATLRQTRANFPKYLANAFEQESKRGTPTPSTGEGNQDESSNVTNMIRERLKELRPLG